MLVLAAGCRVGSPAFRVPEPPSGVRDAIGEESGARLDRALELFDAGELERAEAILRDLAAREPESVLIGRWMQEVELALAAGDGGDGAPEGDRVAALRTAYRARADARPTPAALVLASRIEDDPPSALRLLDRAIALDPLFAWAHHGRAHVLAATGRWKDAREAVEAALAADPAHLPALRLYAWILARAGRRHDAIATLEAWIARVRDEVRHDRGAFDEARLDLALMLLAEGRPEEAQRWLLALHPGSVDEMRRFAALAVVENALGSNLAAREAASAAQRVAPDALLPVVQEALLLEYWLEDPAEAERAWRRVLELAGSSEALGALVQRMRAQVHLSRIERRMEELHARESRE